MASKGDTGLFFFDDGNSNIVSRPAVVVDVLVDDSLVVNIHVVALEDNALLNADEVSTAQPLNGNGNPIPRILIQRYGVEETSTNEVGKFKQF